MKAATNRLQTAHPLLGSQDDLMNVVWVVDSTRLPFYRAERCGPSLFQPGGCLLL